MADTRTLEQLAKEALQVQDACNINVVHGFSKAISRLRELLPNAGTDEINRHNICVLWADKVKSLTGYDYSAAYEWAKVMCEGE